MKPVFVHGLWSDASIWTATMLDLASRGVDSLAVQLPLTSLTDDISMVRRAVAADGGDSHMLVGWSYGGAVVSAAASELPSVKALAFIAAFVPDEDESVHDWSSRRPAPALGQSLRKTDDGFTYIAPERYGEIMVADSDSSHVSMLGRTQKLAHIGVLGAQLPPVAWHDLPSTYLLADDDIVLDPVTQADMAHRAGSAISHASGGHALMQAGPKGVSTFVQESVARLQDAPGVRA